MGQRRKLKEFEEKELCDFYVNNTSVRIKDLPKTFPKISVTSAFFILHRNKIEIRGYHNYRSLAIGNLLGKKNINSSFSVYNIYKKGASRRGLLFDIDFESFDSLINQNCHYCNIPPSNIFKDKNRKKKIKNDDFFYSGLDRKDNKKGYSLDNVVPCCARDNWAKNTMSYEEYIKQIKKTHDHLFNRKTDQITMKNTAEAYLEYYGID